MAAKTDYLRVRCTPAERLELELQAVERGLTLSDVLREAWRAAKAHDVDREASRAA